MPAYAPKPHARKFSPTSFALAVALPGTALAALMLAAPDLITIAKSDPTTVTLINDPPPPPPNPEQVDQPDTPAPPQQVTQIKPLVPVPMPPIEFTAFPPVDPGPINTTINDDVVSGGGAIAPVIEIVRKEATLLTRAEDQRPPYPERRRRLGDEATLKLKLTIGANGRVSAVEPVGTMDSEFLRAAERHIKRVWRYAPATEDGRKVQSVKTITLRFELTDA